MDFVAYIIFELDVLISKTNQSTDVNKNRIFVFNLKIVLVDCSITKFY